MPRSSHVTAAVIGAGPYGISVAAHLRAAGISHRIFGKTMIRWRHMPIGMFLKSEGCASSLSDPNRRHTLARYCADNNLPYGEKGVPVALDVFNRYALSFQKALVPGIEELMVTRVGAAGDSFRLALSDGSVMRAAKVVVATGLEHAEYIPSTLSGLPRELVSHSGDHHDLSRFSGKDVVIVGAGQSALETAALLFEQGASVRVLVREPKVLWNTPPRTVPRSRYAQLRHPASGLGEGVQVWFYHNAPHLFRHLPEPVRLDRVKKVLGPAGSWWLRNRVEGRLAVFPSHIVESAKENGGRLALRVAGRGGEKFDLTTDHVIAATGYQFDLGRLPFLSESLKSLLGADRKWPLLSAGFESRVPGLYFTGVASANSFGPAMRFIIGTDFTARSICRHMSSHSQLRIAA